MSANKSDIVSTARGFLDVIQRQHTSTDANQRQQTSQCGRRENGYGTRTQPDQPLSTAWTGDTGDTYSIKVHL